MGHVDHAPPGSWTRSSASDPRAIAAWIVRHIPPRILGSAVGGIIILTNTRTLLTSDWIDAPEQVRYVVYGAIYGLWAAAVAYRERERVALASA